MIVRSHSRPVTSLRVLCDAAARKGIAAEECLKGTGISCGQLDDPNERHTTDQEVLAIQNYVALAPKQAGLGWEVGQSMHVNAFGIWGFAILTSPTLRAAIHTSIDYVKLSFVIADMDLVELEDRAHLTFGMAGLPSSVHRFVFERHAAVGCNFISEVTQFPDAIPFALATNSGDEVYSCDLASVTGLPISEEASRYDLSFPADLLDQPLPKSDPVSLRYCLEQCQALSEKDGKTLPPWSRKVRDVIVEDIGTEHKIEDVCVTLNVTERTLRRRLTEEGTSFRELYGDVRMTLAHELLDVAGLNVETVAWRVGYSETASFARAFSKKFGETPGSVKRHA